MTRRSALSGLLAVVILLAAACAGREAKLIDLYQSQLDALRGKSAEEALALLTDRWEFQPWMKWEAENPTPQTVLERNHKRVPFSEQEAHEIFKEKGHYEVMILADKGSRGAVTELDEEPDMMLSTHNHSRAYTRYILARVVFRGKQLRDCRFFRIDVSG